VNLTSDLTSTALKYNSSTKLPASFAYSGGILTITPNLADLGRSFTLTFEIASSCSAQATDQIEFVVSFNPKLSSLSMASNIMDPLVYFRMTTNTLTLSSLVVASPSDAIYSLTWTKNLDKSWLVMQSDQIVTTFTDD
jgi:hypothetical protein